MHTERDGDTTTATSEPEGPAPRASRVTAPDRDTIAPLARNLRAQVWVIEDCIAKLESQGCTVTLYYSDGCGSDGDLNSVRLTITATTTY